MHSTLAAADDKAPKTDKVDRLEGVGGQLDLTRYIPHTCTYSTVQQRSVQCGAGQYGSVQDVTELKSSKVL